MLKVARDLRNLNLIVCVVQRGRAEQVWKAARKAGAGGATISFARGLGVRERLGFIGVAIAPEKEVLMVVAGPGQTEKLYEAMFAAARMEIPGQGIIYIQRIDRCGGLVVPRRRKRAR